MKESNVQKLGMCGLSEHDCTPWRNNVGAYKDSNGNYINYGVGGKGAADVLGATTITITPEMVGKQVAVFTSVEFKASKGGRVAPKQIEWRDLILKIGGFAGIAKSEEEAVAVVTDGIKRLKS